MSRKPLRKWRVVNLHGGIEEVEAHSIEVTENIFLTLQREAHDSRKVVWFKSFVIANILSYEEVKNV